jgi:hypothetical protein
MKKCCSGMGEKASVVSSGKIIMSKINGNKDKSPMNQSWPKKGKSK